MTEYILLEIGTLAMKNPCVSYSSKKKKKVHLKNFLIQS